MPDKNGLIEPIRSNRFIVKFFDAETKEVAIPDYSIASVKYRFTRTKVELVVSIRALENLISPADFMQIRFFKAFFLNATGETIGNFVFPVDDYTVDLYHSYDSDELLKYELKFTLKDG